MTSLLRQRFGGVKGHVTSEGDRVESDVIRVICGGYDNFVKLVERQEKHHNLCGKYQ